MKRLSGILLALCLLASVVVAETISLKINSGEALERQFASFREYLRLLPAQDQERWQEEMLDIVISGITATPDSLWSSSSSNNSTSTSSVSMGKRNALQTARDYLDYSAFSYSGLVDQLEFEGYSTDEAKYGADNCGADWNQQAARCAKSYLDFTSFSKSGLIDQLIFEGFTRSQAEYGARQNGY